MHHSQVIKLVKTMKGVNASGLALCCRRFWPRFRSTYVKINIVVHRRLFWQRDNFFFF
jgi:hypothetical protein